jgi:hypothetical protein
LAAWIHRVALEWADWNHSYPPILARPEVMALRLAFDAAGVQRSTRTGQAFVIFGTALLPRPGPVCFSGWLHMHFIASAEHMSVIAG